MLIRVHGSGVELDGRFRDRAKTRLRRNLERFARQLQSVDLQIIDLNGPKGGTDKRGRCVVQLAGRGTVVVEVNSSDTRSVVDLLLRRISQSIGRRISRGSRSTRQREYQRRLLREVVATA